MAWINLWILLSVITEDRLQPPGIVYQKELTTQTVQLLHYYVIIWSLVRIDFKNDV